MTVFCAIPPLDQTETRIGRGFGLGYNRARTAMDQHHGGMDFIAARGTPVLAPFPGDVVLVSDDSGSRSIRGMRGYGNTVVLEHRFDVPGLPNPFWTSYNHLNAPVTLSVGQHVSTGTVLGAVGSTTNGQFAGMGPHLHFEVRRRPFPGSYERDTVDPAILFQGAGLDVVGARREAQRMVGGQLLLREGGPSDCRAGVTPTIAGLFGLGVIVPEGYKQPEAIKSKYPATTPMQKQANLTAPDVEPPDYAAVSKTAVPGPSTSGSQTGGIFVAGAVVLGIYLMMRKS